MTSTAESLARELADMKRRLAALERGTQLTSSTVSTSSGTVSVVAGLEAGIAASAAAAEAIDRAAAAEAKADGAVHTYFGPIEPENVNIGDLWRDTYGTVHQYDGDEWVPISSDAELSEALDRIARTEEALDGKVSTYFVPSRNAPPEDILNEGDLWIVTDGGNLIRRWDGTEWVDAPAGAGALADRAVTSTKLETDLVLTSRIVAGEDGGNRAEMNSEGFHVFDSRREVMRLGVKGADDYMTIVKSDGTPAAGISNEGVMSAQGVSAGDRLWYKGREFTDILDEMPLGVLAQGKRTSRNDAVAAGAWSPFMRIDATLLPGRRYRLTVGPIYCAITSPGVIGVAIIYRYDNVATPALNNGRLGLVKGRTDHDILAPLSVPFEVDSPSGTARSVSFLVAYTNLATGGYVNLTPDNAQPTPCYFTLEDMGASYRTVASGHAGAGNVSPSFQPGPIVPMVADLAPTNRKTYVVGADGTARATSVARADDMYQGFWPDQGSRFVSAVNFNDAVTPLSYGDCTGMMLLVNAQQWYHSASGGTVTLAPHSWTTLPDSFALNSLPTFRIESENFPNPGYRYIPIPSALWNGFKTGQYRGFVFLGDDTSASAAHFGNASHAPNTETPFLEVAVFPNIGGPA